MKTYITILLIVSFMAVIISAKSMHFDPTQGLVIVDVLIDGKINGKFGIDTGADRLYIDKTFAEKNKIDIMRAANQRKIQSVGGSAKAYAASLRSIEIGSQVRLDNIGATVIDIQKITGNKNGQVPDGLIGNQILKQFYVSVDYISHQMELSEEKPAFLRGRKFTDVSYTSYADFIIVDVVLNDKTTIPMIFDYCASHTVITPDVATQLDIDDTNSRYLYLNSVTVGETKAEKVLTVIDDLKDLKRTTPRAKFEGIIGGTFLSNFHITVDYKQKKIYFRL